MKIHRFNDITVWFPDLFCSCLTQRITMCRTIQSFPTFPIALHSVGESGSRCKKHRATWAHGANRIKLIFIDAFAVVVLLAKWSCWERRWHAQCSEYCVDSIEIIPFFHTWRCYVCMNIRVSVCWLNGVRCVRGTWSCRWRGWTVAWQCSNNYIILRIQACDTFYFSWNSIFFEKPYRMRRMGCFTKKTYN